MIQKTRIKIIELATSIVKLFLARLDCITRNCITSVMMLFFKKKKMAASGTRNRKLQPEDTLTNQFLGSHSTFVLNYTCGHSLSDILPLLAYRPYPQTIVKHGPNDHHGHTQDTIQIYPSLVHGKGNKDLLFADSFCMLSELLYLIPNYLFSL